MVRQLLAAFLCSLLFLNPAHCEISEIANNLKTTFDGAARHSATAPVLTQSDTMQLHLPASNVSLNPPPAPAPAKPSHYGSNAGISLLTWLGNLTWGLVNTAIGFLTAIGYTIGHLFSHGRFPEIRFNGTQINVGPEEIGGHCWSLGAFHIGTPAHADHEAGHAKQSALLGPLYLPAVFLSYAGAGFQHGGYIETWADNWAD